MKKIISLIIVLIFATTTMSQTFEEQTWTVMEGQTGTFFGTGYSDSKPLFVDADGDGDLDLIVAGDGSYASYYRNNDINTNSGGTDSVLDGYEFELKKDTFLVLSSQTNLRVTSGDIDGDGNIDYIVGCNAGKLYLFSGLGTLTSGVPDVSAPVYIGISEDTSAHPALNDADNDGDLDLFIGTSAGYIYYYENTGDSSSYSFSLSDSDLLEIGTSYRFLAPSFCDIDGDGDDELFCGYKSGTILFFEKTTDAGSFSFSLSNSRFAGLSFAENTVCHFGDIDDDSDFDLFVGDADGKIAYFVNTGSPSSHTFSKVTDFFNYLDFGTDTTPLWFNMDNSGYDDLIISSKFKLLSLANVSSDPESTEWEVDSLNVATATKDFLRPEPWDYDQDGDLDLFFGNSTGGVGLFRNTGSASSPSFVEEHVGQGGLPTTCFDTMKVYYYYSDPVFFDSDGDGDRDCVIMNSYGLSSFYRNDDIDLNQGGSDDTIDGWSTGDFTEIKSGSAVSSSYFPVSLPGYANGDDWDVDGDGDTDFLVAGSEGSVKLIENTGSAEAPSYVVHSGNYGGIVFDANNSYYVNSNIAVYDFDGDGWFDIVLSGKRGGIKIWRNTAPDDTDAPSAPSSMTATALRHDKVKIQWSRVNDPGGTGVEKYLLKRNGSTVKELYVPCPLTYYDTGLSESTTYNYEITAVDRAGNESTAATATAETGLPPELDHFEFVIPSGIQDETFSMTVNAIDNYSTLFDSFSSTVTLTPSQGSISPTSVTLSGGTKTFTVTYSEASVTEEVVLTINAAYDTVNTDTGSIHLDIVDPSVPSLDTATALDENTVRLTWSGAYDTGGSSYFNIEIHRDGVKIDTVTGGSSYVDYTCSSETTYNYRLRLKDEAGNTASYSNDRYVTTPAPAIDNDPPSIPQGLTLSSKGTDFISFRWYISSDTGGSGVKGYRVYRGPTYIGFTANSYYTDTGLDPDTEYAYFLIAEDNAGNISSYSDALVVRTDELSSSDDETPPTRPNDFAGEALTNTSIRLSWRAATDSGGSGLGGYQIFRSDYDDFNTPIDTAGAGDTSYTDNGLTLGTTYTYKIRAFDNAGNVSSFTDTVHVTTMNQDETAPTVPGNLTGEGVSPTDIFLQWDASTDNSRVSNYNIYAKTVIAGFPSYRLEDTTAGTEITIGGHDPGTQYTYVVTAIDPSDNESGYSNAVTVTTLTFVDDETPPYPPENLRFAQTNSDSVIIEFDAASDNEGGSGIKQYHVYKNDTFLATIDSLEYTDTSVSMGQTVSYYVTAEDYNENVSEPSNEIETTIPVEDNDPPSTPSHLTGEVIDDSVVLNWGVSYDSGSGVNYYEIFRSVNSTPFGKVAPVTEATELTTQFTTYTDDTVEAGVEYIYRVRAKDRSGNVSSFASVSVLVPEVPEAEDYTVYFPHIDSSWIWWTGFSIVNVSEFTANITLRFYSASGEEVIALDEPSTLASGEKFVTSISGLFGGHVPDDIAWLKVDSDQKLAGFELFGTTDSMEMVGVKITTDTSTKLLFPYVYVSDSRWTGIAVINLGTETGGVVFKAYDEDGVLLSTSDSHSLLSYGKVVGTAQYFFDDSLPEGTATIVAESDFPMIGFELFGYLSQDGIAGLSGVSLDDVSGQFKMTSIRKTEPTVESDEDSVQNLEAFVLDANSVELSWDAPSSGSADSYRIYLATVSSTVFGTTIHLDSLLDETAETSFTVTGLSADTEYTFAVLPVSGGDEKNPDDDDVITVTTDLQNVDAKFVYMMPRVKVSEGEATDIYMVNVDEASADVLVESMSDGGDVLESFTLTLGTRSRYSFNVEDRFADLENIKSVRIVSDKELVTYEIFEDSHENRGFDTLFGFSYGMEVIQFTHIAPEVDYWDSNLTIWNLSQYSNDVLLELYNYEGEVLDSILVTISPDSVLSGEVHMFFDDDDMLSQQSWIKATATFPINGYFDFGPKGGGRISAIEAE